TVGSVTDNGNGTYSATVTSPTLASSGVFVATLGGSAVKSGGGSQTQSTLTANGVATQVLTVTAQDANNNAISTGGATVTIVKQSVVGSIGTVTDNGD